MIAENKQKGLHMKQNEDEKALPPMVGVLEAIRRGRLLYRGVFRRAEDFAHVSRYVAVLILSPIMGSAIPVRL